MLNKKDHALSYSVYESNQTIIIPELSLFKHSL